MLLGRALDFYREFRPQKRDDLAVRREAGRAGARVGDIQDMLGDLAAAERSDRGAIATLGELVQSDPAADDRPDLARTQASLGILLKKLNRFEESELAFQAALLHQAPLAEEAPGDPDRLRDLAYSRYHLGALLARLRSRRPKAEAANRAAIDRQRSLAPGPGDPADDRRLLARDENNLGLLLQGSVRAAAAADLLEVFPTDPNEHLLAAQLLVPCLDLAASDPALSPERREERVETDARRAVQ